MKYLKKTDRCATRWCRNKRRGRDYCGTCEDVYGQFRRERHSSEDSKLPWELSCIICAYATPRSYALTQRVRDMVVLSGLLRCPRCGSPAVELERVDRRHTQVRAMTPFKGMARW